MKTVTYLTRRRMLQHGALGIVGGFLSARDWADAAAFPHVRWVTLSHPRLPLGFDGMRVAQISDVHAGVFMPPQRLAQVRELVASLEPDLIVFTGDQLDRRDVDADIFVHGFAGMQAPRGVFGILGNHDHIAGRSLAIAAMEASGIQPLINDTAVLERDGDHLLLAGVDDLESEAPHGPDYSVLTSNQADFRLLLCHQPNGWAPGRAAGADLVLSGHTHGGQITIPSRGVNVARLMTPYVAGPYRKKHSLLYVSRGVGVGALPVRFGSMPEVDLITLARGPLSGVSV